MVILLLLYFTIYLMSIRGFLCGTGVEVQSFFFFSFSVCTFSVLRFVFIARLCLVYLSKCCRDCECLNLLELCGLIVVGNGKLWVYLLN